MADKADIRREALKRQGTLLETRHGRFRVEGDGKRALFQTGAEGLVQPAVDERTGKRFRIKVFWEPDDDRLARSRALVQRSLASTAASRHKVDVLGGAPFALLDAIGGESRFAVVMKSVAGASWKDLCRDAEFAESYPPPEWPSLRVRWLWACGLAAAVERMEKLDFVHADLSDGNLVAVKDGAEAGAFALVDFDAYYNPHNPSHYLGTNGFVAPEIWTRGAVGKGSDRFAMAILIQKFLLSGDSEFPREDVFHGDYSQEEICALTCKAHPLLRRKYPAIAELLDATLAAPDRAQRPTPSAWQQALRALPPARKQRFFLAAHAARPPLQVPLVPGQSVDLAHSLFRIRAAITLRDQAYVRPYPGAAVRVQNGAGDWQELASEVEAELAPGGLLADRAGELQAQLVVSDSAAEGASLGASNITPDSFTQAGLLAFAAEWLRHARALSPSSRAKHNLALGAALAACLLAAVAGVVHLIEQPHPHPVTPPVVRPRASRDNSAHARPEPDTSASQTAHTQEAQQPHQASVQHAPPAAAQSYQGASSGELTWSGTLKKGDEVAIANGQASTGTLSGQPLPGVPVSITVSDPQMAVTVQPNPTNRFAAVTLRSTTNGPVSFVVRWAVLPVD